MEDRPTQPTKSELLSGLDRLHTLKWEHAAVSTAYEYIGAFWFIHSAPDTCTACRPLQDSLRRMEPGREL